MGDVEGLCPTFHAVGNQVCHFAVEKNKLVDYIRKSFRDTWLKNQGDPSRIVSLMDKINPNDEQPRALRLRRQDDIAQPANVHRGPCLLYTSRCV